MYLGGNHRWVPLTVVNAVTFSLPNLPISAVRFSVKRYFLQEALLTNYPIGT